MINREYVKLIMILFLLAIFVNIGLSIISPLISILKTHLHSTILVTGVIFGLFPIARGIVSPICGKFIDKFSMKYLLIIGFSIYVIASFLYILADTAALLSLVRIIQGVAAGLTLPAILAYAGFISFETRNNIATNLTITALQMGVAFGPFIGGIVFDCWGYNSVFVVMAAIEIVALILVLLFVPKQKKEANLSNDHIEPQKKMPRPPGNMLKFHLPALAIIFQFTAIFVMTIIMVILSVYSSNIPIPLSISQIGIIIFVMIVISSLMVIPVGKCADKLTKRQMSSLFLLISGGILLVVPLFFYPNVSTFSGLILLSAIVGVGAGIIFPTINSISYIIGRVEGIGLWWGLIAAINSMAYFLGSLLATLIFIYFGCDNVFYLSGMLGVVLVSFGTYHAIRRLRGNISYIKKLNVKRLIE